MNGIPRNHDVTGRKVTTPEASLAAYGGPVVLHDGDGWVNCRCGQRHWGRHGAAGLLLARPADPPSDRSGPTSNGGAAFDDATAADGSSARLEVLLQLRAGWTHQGGSWALPGGARDSHEDAVTAALREAHEEAGLDGADLAVLGELPGVDHVDWSYTYVLAVPRRPVRVTPMTSESQDLRWLAVAGVAALPLHPAFGAAWPGLLTTLLTTVPTA